ncbi:MAG: DsbA family protein [Chitinophaga sp.]|uniref:DsbA family protein n=1 Tax=Chitinophaga sp. TaxID=1869181 RepID=UPI0025C53EFE|nr:DsbA family protein [Chitinophaga sp.]MBV8252431.1 DsbA family protein [Chitinophaga sp.]
MKLIYVMDPYCGWCYGTSEQVEKLAAHYGDQMQLEVLPAGMWAGANARPQNSHLARYIQSHDLQVASRTGAKFTDAYFRTLQDASRILDSEIPSRAIVTVNEKWPHLLLTFTHAIQHARFVEAKDLSNNDTYIAIAESLGIPADQFLQYFHSDAMRLQTLRTFEKAATYAHSYPSILMVKGTKLIPIEQGYEIAETIIRKINQRFNEAYDINLN